MAAAGIVAYLAACIRQYDRAVDARWQAGLADLVRARDFNAFRAILRQLKDHRAERGEGRRASLPRLAAALLMISYAVLAVGVVLGTAALRSGVAGGSHAEIAARSPPGDVPLSGR